MAFWRNPSLMTVTSSQGTRAQWCSWLQDGQDDKWLGWCITALQMPKPQKHKAPHCYWPWRQGRWPPLSPATSSNRQQRPLTTQGQKHTLKDGKKRRNTPGNQVTTPLPAPTCPCSRHTTNATYNNASFRKKKWGVELQDVFRNVYSFSLNYYPNSAA